MKFDIVFLRFLGAAFVAYSVIFFIALRLQNSVNYKKKSILSLIVGGVIFAINVIGIAIDIVIYGLTSLLDEGYYLAFPIMAILYTIVLALIFFFMGNSRSQSFVNIHEEYMRKKIKEERQKKPTIKDETEYLYLALRHEGSFLLKEVDGKDGNKEYGGLVVKFHKNDFFHDEFVEKVIDNFGLEVIDKKLAGVVTQKRSDNANNKYYVYDIEINEITSSINDLSKVSPLVLYGYNMSEFNKQVLFHVVLKEYFEIEV